MQAAVTPLHAVPHLRLSGLALGAGAALAGIVLGQLTSLPSRRPRRPCEACNGDGYVDCLCARWSNAPIAAPTCANCRGSLRTRCPRCRGGGTAVPSMIRVPIPVRVHEHADRLLSVLAFVVGGTAVRLGRRRIGASLDTLVAAAPGRPRRQRPSRTV